jgi:ATP-dependent Lhr-like helicase
LRRCERRGSRSPRAGAPRAGRREAGVRSPERHAARRPVDSPRAGAPGARWSLTAPLFAGPLAADPAARARALAELLLERHGILTRELVLAEGIPGGFAALYPELCKLETLGAARRGYFVEGLGGAQFALPGAVERLRAERPESTAGSNSPKALVLAATDPAQPYGAALPWPRREAPVGSARHNPARVPGALVVLVGAEPALYLERGGRALRVLLAGAEDPDLPLALGALAEHVRTGRLAGRIALERVDGEPVLGTRWETVLVKGGFRAGPRRLTLSA